MKSGHGSCSVKRTRDGETTVTSFTFSCSSFALGARERKLHILRRERVAIVELEVLAQLES